MASINKRCLSQTLVFLLLAGAVSGAALAQTAPPSNVTVNVTGRIVGSCGVGSIGPNPLNLTIPAVDAGTLTAVGAVATPRATEQLLRINCTGFPGVRMTMAIGGTSPDPAQSVLPNTATTGAATNVGVQLFYGAQGTTTARTLLRTGTNYDFTGGAAISIPFSAQYYVLRTNPAPTAGTVTATATLTFTVL
ncbi:fimbrial protein [Ralstonia sp. 24A2]|uniref:fimbrial protein n=1 Tax=Ralstonia sp. 24A2 TaxID=3447364 RepID=UPI003F69E9A9